MAITHNEQAERSVIGAVLLRNDAAARVRLRPEDFHDPRLRTIWHTILGLVDAHQPIDGVSISARINGEGGKWLLSELSDCVKATPTADNVEYYAEIVAAESLSRRVRVELEHIAKDGQLDGEQLLDAAERVVTLLRPPPAVAVPWAPLPLAYLTEQPAVRRWLLRHPTRDGNPCAPCAGDGMLPLGKVGILAAEGGAGKTMLSIGLGMAVATGRKWLGHFEVDYAARRGRVLMALAEEDAEEVHRRLYATAEAYGLTMDERRCVTSQLVVLPLAGRPVALVGYAADGRTPVETSELADLRRRLMTEGEEDGWSLVILDPLARWAGPDVEADNSAATRFLQSLETLTTVPGNPTVLVPHHSSKLARRTGTVDSRGVTALTDGARWAASVRTDGKDVYFQQVKSNYSRPMPEELRLVRGPGGLVRVPSEIEEAEHALVGDERAQARARKTEERDEARVSELMARIAEALRSAVAPVTSVLQLRGLVGGGTTAKSEAVARLLVTGTVRCVHTGKGKQYVL